MQPGEQPVHGTHPALRGDHQIGPALRRPHHPVARGRLQRADRGRADRHDPAAARAGRVHQPRGASGTENRSGYGGSCASPEDTPVCSITGAICTPRLTSAVTSPAVKGRPRSASRAEPSPSREGTENTV